ncbi:MAG: glycoside hydrolase family 97 N-terminal domain-containing protein, partial [Saprospiraceae bacterium]|nr:glycoside hydrolase family 97 N-terminal domain-containing protein [Saprospiraceae bacterium]
MRKQFIFLFALLISSNALLAQVFSEVVKSPDGKVQATVTFDKKRGNASYKVRYKGKEIIKESKLGLKVRGEYLYTGMVMLGSHTATQKGTWKPVWGETEEIEEHYNELTLELKDALKLKMNIVFRVFNDGVGFRYEFPDTKQVGLISVLQDATVFNMAEDFETWWAPSDWDSNEHTYSHTKISEIDATKYLSDIEPFNQHIVDVKAVQTPVTMQSGSGVCVSIAEAALADFGALHLKADSSGHNFTAFVIPGINPEIATVNGLPFKMPWRAILLSPDAAGLLTNHLILNLNEPCKIKGDLSWIKPQKYVGIWWELHIGKSGWNYREA